MNGRCFHQICLCFKPLTNKKAKLVLDGFIRIENKSKHKPNELWVDQGR